MVNVAINGFGRIGRMFFRAAHDKLKIVAINDLGDINTSAHLLKYDSVYGKFSESVSVKEGYLVVGGKRIKYVSECNPEKLPWKDLGIDVVMECSGRFTDRALAIKHLTAGAKHVLISAPATGADITVVYGVNHSKLHPDHQIISNGSCTTSVIGSIPFIS